MDPLADNPTILVVAQVFTLLTSIGVYVDMSLLIRSIPLEKRGPIIGQNSPLLWALCCSLFWLIAFPCYLFIARRRLRAYVVASRPFQRTYQCEACHRLYEGLQPTCPHCHTRISGGL